MPKSPVINLERHCKSKYQGWFVERVSSIDVPVPASSNAPESNTKSPPPQLEWILVYLSFGYHLWLVPFKYKWNPKDQCFQIKKNIVQKVICCLLSVLSILQQLSYVRSNVPRQFDSPLLYITTIDLVLSVLGVWTFVHMNWFIPVKWEQFFAQYQPQIEDETSLQRNRPRNPLKINWFFRKSAFFAKLFCIIFLIAAILIYFSLRRHLMLGNLEEETESIVDDMKQALLIPTHGRSKRHMFPLIPILSAILMIHVFMANLYRTLFLLISALTLLDEVSRFTAEYLLEDGHVECEEVLLNFEILKRRIEHLNRLSSLVVLTSVMRSMTYYAIAWKCLISCSDWMERARYAFYCVRLISIYIAAEAHEQAKEFNKWMHSNAEHHDIDHHQLSVTLTDLAERPIGIKGFSFFTISYPFFGAMMSTLLTYFFLYVQFVNLK